MRIGTPAREAILCNRLQVVKEGRADSAANIQRDLHMSRRWTPALTLCILMAAVATLAAQAAPSAGATVNPLQLKAHHVTASVIDLERAMKWYQEMLGFKVVNQGSRQNGAFKFADLAIPGFGIGLVQNGATAAAPPAGPPRPAWVHIVFSVPDPNRAFMLLMERGAAPTTRQNGTGPVATFLVHDSEGNEIEIVRDDGQ